MSSAEISIILPVRNIENEITGILRSLLRQTTGLNVEIIVVDMGSQDQTILESVQFIKELQLNGCVIQNGNGSVSAALNTGIQKSTGDFITFIFARRLYRNFIKGYLETIRFSSADLVFGRVEGSGFKAPNDGPGCLKALLNGELQMDISALMLRKSFLQERQIYFQESCCHGYAEEFVFQCLLLSHRVAQSPTLLYRDKVFELRRGKTGFVGKDIFQHVDAMLRIKVILDARCQNDRELQQLFVEEKLPATVMHCVDIMLEEGNGYNAVRGYLKVHHYDSLLSVGRKTSRGLRRRVQCWKRIPWMYKTK